MSNEPMNESSNAPQVIVEQSIPYGAKAVWDCLISPQGEQVLLGEGASLGDKGDDWQATDGHHGVMRSFHAPEEIRFSWHASEGDPATLVEVNLTGEGEAASHLEIKHTKLPESADTTALREHWEKVIDRLAMLLGGE